MRTVSARTTRGVAAACLSVLALGSHLACNSIAGLNDLSFTSSEPSEPVCEPFATKACYHGPEGSEGVGPCQGGTQTCFPDGSAYGLCDGETLPSTEVCGNMTDEDCDGALDNGCPCEPGAKQPCYSGPGRTLGVGACQAGSQFCLDDGSSYGPCEGEVLPVVENCTTPGDDDCDGLPACGAPVSTFTAGDVARQELFSLDAGPNAQILLGGSHAGSFSLGSVTLSAAGAAKSAFVAVRDTAQSFSFGGSFGGSMFDAATHGVAFNSSGDLLITGTMSGTIDFGGGMLVANGAFANDAFLARFDAAGNHVWSFLLGDASDQSGEAVAFTPSDDILVAGNFGGDLDFGGGVLVSSSGNQNAFLAKLAPDGVAQWALAATGQKDQSLMDLAIAPTGEAVIALASQDDVTINGVNHPAQQDDVVLVKVKDTGAVSWVSVAGDASIQVPNALTVTPGGDVVVVGEMQGTMVLGGCSLTATNGIDAFVAQLTSGGSCTWAKVYAAANAQRATAVAADATGNLIVAGVFQGSVDFGDGQPVDSNAVDAFVLKLDPSGSTLWKHVLSGSGNAYPTDITVGDLGTVTVGGYFDGDIDFGDGAVPVTSQGDRDLFLVDLSP